MMIFLWLTLSVMPDFLTKGAMASATNLPADQAVSTLIPSVSMMHSHVGTRLASTSALTTKYVRAKLVVMMSGLPGSYNFV